MRLCTSCVLFGDLCDETVKHLAGASTGATKGRRLEDEKMDGKKTRKKTRRRIRGNVDLCDDFFVSWMELLKSSVQYPISSKVLFDGTIIM